MDGAAVAGSDIAELRGQIQTLKKAIEDESKVNSEELRMKAVEINDIRKEAEKTKKAFTSNLMKVRNELKAHVEATVAKAKEVLTKDFDQTLTMTLNDTTRRCDGDLPACTGCVR